MKWYERLGVAHAAFGDAATSFWDVIQSAFGENDKTIGETLGSALVRTPVGIGHGLYQTVAAPVQGIAEGLEFASDVATYPLRTVYAAKLLAQSPTWHQTLGVARQGDFWAPRAEAAVDYRTWIQAWEEASNLSLGQAIWLNPGIGEKSLFGFGADLADREQVAKLKDDALFNVVSGLTDAAVAWYADPVTGVLKLGGAAKKVSNTYGAGAHANDPWLEKLLFQKTGLGVKDMDPYMLAQSDRVDEFLAWASGRSAREIIKHPMLDKMPKKDDGAGILAGLLADQDMDTARLVIAVGFGSEKAFAKLQSQSAELANRISSMRNRTNSAFAIELVSKDIVGAFLPAQVPIVPRPGSVLVPLTSPFGKDGAEQAARMARQMAASSYPALGSIANGVLKGDVPAHLKAWTADPRTMEALAASATQSESKLALITAAIGEHAESGGIWGDMIYRVPKGARDSRRADKAIRKDDIALAYETGSFSKWKETFVPGGIFGKGVRIVSYPGFRLAHGFTHNRPPSWIDPNRKDASAALSAYMRHAKAFSDEQHNGLMNEYLTAMDIGERANIVQKIETQAIMRLGMKYGLTGEEALLIAQEGIGRRNKIITQVKKSRGEGGVMGVTDSDGNAIRWSMYETQEVNSVPLVDLVAYERRFKKQASFLKTVGMGAKFDPKQFLEDAYEVFNGIWTTANLLRIGYMVRNVTDDTLRVGASLGTQAFAGMLSDGVRAGLGTNAAIRSMNTDSRLSFAAKSSTAFMARLTGADPLVAQQVVAESFDRMGRDLGSVRTQSELGVVYGGNNYRGPYEGKGESYKFLVGSTFNNLTNTSQDILNNLRSGQGEWKVIAPGDEIHLDSWVHAIHNQIGKSEIGRRFLEGMSGEQVLSWLTKTKDGRSVLRRLGRKDKNDPTDKAWYKKSDEEIEELVGTAQAVTDNYVPILDHLDDPMILRRMALEGKVTRGELEKLFPSNASRPHVHGPTVDFNLSQGPVYDALEAITNTGFKWLGQMPTDKLVRHPVFRRLYIGNIRRYHNLTERQLLDPKYRAQQVLAGNLTERKGVSQWTDAHLRRIEHISRERSLKQLNDLLYDGSTKSNMAHKLRFVSAFFSAWQDSMTKWARIAVDKPEVLVNGAKLWNAPNEMNLGSTEDPITGERVPRFIAKRWNDETNEWEKAPVNWNPLEYNEQAYMELRLPEGIAKLIPGHESGTIQISKPSMNLVLQGDPWWLPGAGPITQFAISKYALAHPTTLPEVYKWAIPFGADDSVKSLLPAWAKRLWDSGESITDQTRANAFSAIAQTQIMNAKLGKRSMPKDAEFYKEIEKRTDDYFKLRAFTSFIAPFSVSYKSPYQFYIDELQKFRGQSKPEDDFTADEKFLETHGDDFYIFTMSMSKNVTGLPASREAWDKSQKVQDLIAENPELAMVHVGQIANQEFDQYVYDAQRRQEIKDGSGRTSRMGQSPKAALESVEISQGWREFTQVMDLIDSVQYDPSLPEGFLDFFRKEEAKKIAIARPEWAKEYYQTDREKVPRNVKMLTDYMMKNPREVLRPEIQQLAKYMTVREQFQEKLLLLKAQGKPSTLDAKANRLLAEEWKTTQEKFAEENTVFGRIFWRFLSNDRLQTSALDEEVT